MPAQILILGASYGSLLATKLAMAGHDVSLVCRTRTAALINDKGTEIRIKLKGDDGHRSIFSANLEGRIDAVTPEDANLGPYDLVVLAMQEPQYGHPSIRDLMYRITKAALPCLSIMNMPPLTYLRRIDGLDSEALAHGYTHPEVWSMFEPGLMTLASPDPQAFRPPQESPNILHVGLPTNFKTAGFVDRKHTALLHKLAADIEAVRLDDMEVPVKLKVHESIFVPLAKWSMLLTGNYRCIDRNGMIPIKSAVHGDLEMSRSIYGFVDDLTRDLGARPDDQVPFEKYARAAESLIKPSSVARAVDAGAVAIERVDRLVQQIARSLGRSNLAIDAIVATVDARLAENIRKAA